MILKRVRMFIGLGFLCALSGPLSSPAQDSGTHDRIHQWLRAKDLKHLEQHFTTLQKQYEAGQLRLPQMRAEILSLRAAPDASLAGLNDWVRANPRSYWAHLARGIFYVEAALKRRGSDWAKDTSRQAFREMKRYLAVARTDLEASLPLTRKPYHSLVELITVERYSDDDESARKWLARANQLAPENIGARRQYLTSLSPRWGGSYEAMEEFVAESERDGVAPAALRILKAEIPEDKGSMAEIAKSYVEAMQYYREALTITQPGADDYYRTSALEGYIRAATTLNRLADAASELDELIRIEPAGWSYSQRAWIYEQKKEYDKAWPLHVKAANLGSAYSQSVVGWNLYNGAPSVPQDKEAGLKLLRQAAAQGDTGAQKFLELIPEGKSK